MFRRILLVAVLAVFFAALSFTPLFFFGFAIGQITEESTRCANQSSSICQALRVASVALFPAGILASVGAATWFTAPEEPLSRYFGIATLSVLILLAILTVMMLAA